MRGRNCWGLQGYDPVDEQGFVGSPVSVVVVAPKGAMDSSDELPPKRACIGQVWESHAAGCGAGNVKRLRDVRASCSRLPGNDDSLVLPVASKGCSAVVNSHDGGNNPGRLLKVDECVAGIGIVVEELLRNQSGHGGFPDLCDYYVCDEKSLEKYSACGVG